MNRILKVPTLILNNPHKATEHYNKMPNTIKQLYQSLKKTKCRSNCLLDKFNKSFFERGRLKAMLLAQQQ